ncbi:MAG: hypothetical protein MJB57_12245 [Gemmatimonadetes bacterium]|nr:hypothetical protein [Gemmatimonadota bacterium]
METDCCVEELATKRWSISSELLKILWHDVFPRIVTRHWESPEQLKTKSGWADVPTFLGDAAGFIKAYADDLYYTGVGSDEFRARLKKLRKYLRGKDPLCPKPIPLYGLPGEGFDFNLSDDGLELLLPPDPWAKYQNPELEIYRMYTFRRTATRAIKVPGVTGAPRETSIPNAITTDTIESLVSLPRTAVTDLSDALGGDRAAADRGDMLTKMLESPSQSSSSDDAGHGCHDWIDLASYCGQLADCRCWQLSGRTYRGILHDLPRLIAWIWLEQEAEAKAGITGPAKSVLSYEERFHGKGNEGLRGLFRERLEIILPDEACMRFETSTHEQVIVTNQGLFFPELPKRPSRAALLDAWKQGSGGIPVFSDSSRTG